ncbi:MAG: nicotinate (nicotinamide) nucleotide adenylyltransferase [Ruminococcaceae bacterium]|nr:nicotinate (nicotinamide) nucleotide adenylyltransferase [Oscillospiraceae bacterium]
MRIGFMGGTFSPPHIGHLHSAKAFIEELNLDRLIIIPAKVSPFKVNVQQTASDKDRMEMARLCFLSLDCDNCSVEVSDIEISKDTTSYTIDTVNELKALYPNDELYMFVGSDMFLSLERWKNFKDIFEKCHIYTRTREYNERYTMLLAKEKYEKTYGARVYLSDDQEIIVSSTDIRNALSSKSIETCQNLLTDEVFGYIIKGGLYFDQH